MEIPIDQSENTYTPSPKLSGKLVLANDPIVFPEPQGKPWPTQCRAFPKPFEKVVCMLAHDAGARLLAMFRAFEELSKDHWSDKTNDDWKDFLEDNPDANMHYLEFATQFQGLLEIFDFDLATNGHGGLFTYPLFGIYDFRVKPYHGLPPVWGSVTFISDPALCIPLSFTIIAKNYKGDKSPKLDYSSSSSIYAAQSSSSIPGMFLRAARISNPNPDKKVLFTKVDGQKK